MIVETHHVAKRFGRFEAIEDLSLSVPEGSVFALIGPNGAGKTTTIRMLMNILRPDRGDITVLGTPSRELAPKDFERIGYVSESQKLPDGLTLAQYFDYLRSLYPAWDRALEKELCEQFELPPSRKIKHLSHGMRMKTLLVGALAFRPKLLVLDEPLSGLDTLVRDEVVNGLLQQAADTTILISSHELAEIESFTTHVAFMQNGRLLLQEAIESLQTRFREVLGDAFGGEGAAAAAAPKAGCCRRSKATACVSSLPATRVTSSSTSNWRSTSAPCRWNASPCRCARSPTRSCSSASGI